MRNRLIFALVGLLIAVAWPSFGATFYLTDGTAVEGTVIRTDGSRVVIQTGRGISSYDVSEFNRETRDTHFPEIMESEPPPAPRQATVPTPPKSSRQPRAAGELKSMGLVGITVVGYILLIVSSIWLIVAGFSVSPLWGIALLLFNGIAGLAFLILHWDRARSPMFMGIIGWGMVLSVMWLA